MEVATIMDALLDVLKNAMLFSGNGNWVDPKAQSLNFLNIYESFLNRYGEASGMVEENRCAIWLQTFPALPLFSTVEKCLGQKEEEREVKEKGCTSTVEDEIGQNEVLLHQLLYLSKELGEEQELIKAQGKVQLDSQPINPPSPETLNPLPFILHLNPLSPERYLIHKQGEELGREEKQGDMANLKVDTMLTPEDNKPLPTIGNTKNLEEIKCDPNKNQEKGSAEEKVNASPLNDGHYLMNSALFAIAGNVSKDSPHPEIEKETTMAGTLKDNTISKGKEDTYDTVGYREAPSIQNDKHNFGKGIFNPEDTFENKDKKMAFSVPLEMEDPVNVDKIKEKSSILHLSETNRAEAMFPGTKNDKELQQEKIEVTHRKPGFEDYIGHGHREPLKTTDENIANVDEAVKAPLNLVERIERTIEETIHKNGSSDVVLRLKINEDDAILIGFKREGKSITVDIKSMDSRITSVIQNNRDAIVRNLEEKHIYANIFVNPDKTNDKNNRKEFMYPSRRNFNGKGKSKGFKDILEKV